MPMDRKLYPPNWEELALSIKEAANWHCQECNRPCRKPGESFFDLYKRIGRENWQWARDLDGEDENGEPVLKLGRFTLTVAHLNHQPEDCRSENLKALCSVCHCRYDLKAMPTKQRLKRERLGQLTLNFEAEAI